MSFASFCILFVSLLLVGLSALAGLNMNSMLKSIEGKNEVLVFLEDNTSPERTEVIGTELKKVPNIKPNDVVFYSKEEAFEKLQKDMEAYGELFKHLDENPLADSYKIRVADISKMNDTVAQIGLIKNVEHVRAPVDFAKFIEGISRIVSVVSTIILLALVAVCLVIISNTTKASVFARRKEISIMKYVGATNTFIRIPFFIEGMLIGMAAGAGASFVTWAVYDSLLTVFKGEMDVLMVIGLTSLIPFSDVSTPVLILYLVAGAVLGAVGSLISTRKHLDV
jgi:cell division transport system permease protein